MIKLSYEEAMKIADNLWFRHTDSTIIAVLQDVESKEVLMVGHMNREAFIKTLTQGYAHFWSISRKKLWLKGETSGHYQIVEGFKIDCDGDAIVLFVKSVGPVCHTGNKTCFYRSYSDLVSDLNKEKELGVKS
ncbi:phosphoribosyl-AMP cyclohydrolase [Stygiolobus caldivivus]|uniref:Phosphoribosyl-AMP cyclohydrolase n=1 Tax=Stygiolobus caldivivus TaxID=2824673 RepID=A0A8D5U852_9CREN|nr:phosphoribosyl-AMP cyclohydrolase [Stygiolobus caldivivus]